MTALTKSDLDGLRAVMGALIGSEARRPARHAEPHDQDDMSITRESIEGLLPQPLIEQVLLPPTIQVRAELGKALEQLLTDVLTRYDGLPEELRQEETTLGMFLGAWVMELHPRQFGFFLEKPVSDRVGLDTFLEELNDRAPYFHRSPLATILNALLFTIRRHPDKPRAQQAAATVELLRQHRNWLLPG